jgi:CarD family transcriptional regulator
MAHKQKIKAAATAMKKALKTVSKAPVAKAQAKPVTKAAQAVAKSAKSVKPAAKPVVKSNPAVAAKAKVAPAKKAAPVKAKVAVKAVPVKPAVAAKTKAAVKIAVPPKAVAPKAVPKVAPAVQAAAVKPVPAQAAQSQRAVPASIAKPAGQKITAPAPVSGIGQPPAGGTPATPKMLAERAAAARQIMAANKKPVSARHGFKTNEFVVYPAHGVGRIVGIEEQEIAGISLELFVITFDKEKLTLRVPTGKLASLGLRKLAEEGVVKRAMETLKGRARVKRTMWSRRAQEYVAKINSGDLTSIAEVVRDLYRSEAQPEQSYSERQLYENALERMAREIAAVERLDERGAVQRIVEILSKSAKGRRLAAEGIEATDDAGDIKAA